MKIWLVGGGTAGHVLPLQALASELALSQAKANITLVIDRAKVARSIADEGGAWNDVRVLFSGKFRRYQGRSWAQRMFDLPTLLFNLRDVIYILIGLIQTLILGLIRRPNVIFINGGSLGVPVSLVARLLNIPYLIHESDVEPGLANRLAGKHAKRILLGLAPLSSADNKRYFITGIPTRSAFKSVLNHKQADLKQKMGFDPDKPLIVITGGSQGSERLNEIIASIASSLIKIANVGHISGLKHEESLKRALRSITNSNQYKIWGYIDQEMPQLLGAADVVVSRSGATIISDLGFLQKPVILIPNPHLARHQGVNAKIMAENEAALVLDENELTENPDILLSSVTNLLTDTKARDTLAQNIKVFSNPNATADIAKHILQVADLD